jgi:hypothetical protein
MTSLAQAKAAVRSYLQHLDHGLPAEDDLILLEEKILEHQWGWVFFYTSRLWNETTDLQYAIAGNGPLFFERHSGRIIPTGTAMPVEHYIANYEHTGSPIGSSSASA